MDDIGEPTPAGSSTYPHAPHISAQTVEDYTRALDKSPHDHEIYVMRSEARANADDLSGAFADLDRAIQIHPDSARAYRLRGRIKQRLGEVRGADDDFQKAKTLEGASTDQPS
jgi:Flp pilus assembly protein TadD